MTDRLRRAWRAGPRGLPSLPLAAVLVALASYSAYSILPVVEAVVTGYYAFDWENFIQAAARLDAGRLYEFDYPYAYRWSPAAAWILGFVTVMPLWLWQVLHLAVLLLLRPWWLAAACLVSYPLWFDIQTGNVMIFVAVAGLWAARGSGLAGGLFLALTLLVPRPLMLPLAGWLLWEHPQWRLPFALMFIGHAVVVLMSGYGPDWLSALLTVAPEFTSDFNFGPSALIGLAWAPIGAVVAGWLTLRGHLGLASLAASPYWLPYYFLMLLLESVPTPGPTTTGMANSSRPAIRTGARRVRRPSG